MNNGEKSKVYLESTIFGYLAGRPSAIPKTAYWQALTRQWWEDCLPMDFLLSWNCRHIANPETRPLIRKVCEEMGYRYPEICTPFEMLGGTP